MQTQTQLPGQVPGCIPLQNKPQTSWSRTWQSDGDMQLRRDVLGRIIQIFQKCKTEFTPEWQQKLPDVVKHVEEALYYDAASKEEYGDSRTLERRLQIVAPRILPSIAQNGQQRAVTSLEEGSRSVASMVNSNPVNGSGMVPTPGLGGNMIPTPGFAGSMMASRAGMMPTPGLSSNKLPASVNSAGNFAANSTASTSNVFSNMMPTPGSSNLLNHQGGNGIRMMQTGQLPVASGFTNGMMPTPGLSIQQQQQQANFMKVGDISVQRHLVRSMNAHLNGNTQLRSPVMNSGMSDTILMNRQQLVNGNIGMPDPNFSNQTSFLLPQQRINQHSRLQMSVPSVSNDTYAMNAADLAGSGSLYSSLSSGGNGVGLNSQISKMQGQQQQESQQQQQQQQNLQQQQQQQQQSLQQQQQQNLQQQQQQQHSQFQQLQFQSQRIQFQQSDMSMQQQTQEPLEMSRQKQQIVELQNTAIATSVKQVDRPPPAPIKLEHQSSPQLHESAWQQSNGNQVNEQKDRVALADQQDDVKQSHDGKPGDQSGVAPVQLGAQSPVSTTRAQQYVKQQRWLLFLRHASKCSYTGGQCPSSPHCFTAKQLLSHIAQCRDRTRECAYPRCSASIRLLTHHQDCREPRCPVCGPVRQAFMRHPSLSQGEVPGTSPPGASSSNNVREGGTQQPPLKRIKTENNKGSGEDGIGVKMEDQVSSAKSEWRDTPPHVKAEPGALKQEDCDVKPCALTTKVAKPQIIGVSLTELFTPEQIRQHITGLRQWVGQSKTKAEKNQAMEHSLNENACRLCAVEKLSFEPPPIYCTSCGIRIKRNAFYHTTAIRETRHYFCVPCYNEVRTETIEMEGLSYAKATLEKRKHEEEIEEAWVQCDKCNLWQHQVCALFNSRRNEGGEAEYTCPQCCMAEMEMGERLSLPATAVLGAKDLPRTVLSDQLEQRLAAKLKQERLERCKAQGKSYDDVPGAEGLVVRVVSSVDKKLEVKQRFLEIFQEEDYPAEFPYKSKAVLLFQKIEGVEVCLYGMYVQEFGAECTQPNQRRVYLSYLDSVKYFRPDVKTCSGEALRTFVYHELLIGYLDYCKKRGFSSCYIWACPPLKGEDYILYCHPEIQKTPKSDKLREWYLTMLRKASKESIVVEVTNFYDYFFISSGECKAKVTAARLPYFDGDYWPGAAEDMILQLQQEDDDGTKQPKKGKTKKPATKRATKAAAQAEMLMNASKDAQLMQKLGESIMPMKEDFIMVHMHYTCFHCRNFIITGYRWGCRTCKNFQLCNDCYEVESRLDERERHPANIKEKHLLTPVEVNDVPSDTKDIDEIMESEFFDTRHAFLSLCQGNHYQYDTLRRAKHSSMMVLYHLHNPMAPAFVTTCSMCNHDIETGQGWRCETCAEFDLCDGCHLKDEAKKHPHKLTPHPSTSDRNAQNKEARQQRVLQLRKMLDLLVHASQCCAHQCQYPNCCNLKRLFRHGMACPKRIAGGCMLCKKMWYFMQLHARACKESQCRVPRCKDLKEHLRRLQHQMESRRRAAVNEMMRQRAAETAGRS